MHGRLLSSLLLNFLFDFVVVCLSVEFPHNEADMNVVQLCQTSAKVKPCLPSRIGASIQDMQLVAVIEPALP